MTKIFTLAAAAFLCSTIAQAQPFAVPNGGMETWVNYTATPIPFGSPVTLERPMYWHGSDSLAVAYGLLLAPHLDLGKQIFKETDMAHVLSGSAARLESAGEGDTVLPAILANAEVEVDITDLTFDFKGGTPVTSRISAVNASVKYVSGDDVDMGVISIIAVVDGSEGDSIVGFGGTLVDETGYTTLTMPISYLSETVVPQRIQIVFSSGSLEDFGIGSNASRMWVDGVFLTDEGTGIETVIMGENVAAVYPNPATNVLHLQNKTGNKLTAELYNAAGQRVAATELIKEANIETSALPAGLYFYTIRNNGIAVQSGRVVVAH